jgi:hypothetical protein
LGHESVQTTARANGALAGDFYAVFRRRELSRKHEEYSAVATMARDGKL